MLEKKNVVSLSYHRDVFLQEFSSAKQQAFIFVYAGAAAQVLHTPRVSLERQHDVGLGERAERIWLPVFSLGALSVGVHLDVIEAARATLEEQLGRAAKKQTQNKTPTNDRKNKSARTHARTSGTNKQTNKQLNEQINKRHEVEHDQQQQDAAG